LTARAIRERNRTVPHLKIFYFKSGEIITGLTLAVFAFYILRSFVGAEGILENESGSETIVREICRQEAALHEETGSYGGFDAIEGGSPLLGGLRRVPLKNYDSMDLATDGKYFYLIHLVYPSKTASDLVDDASRGEPIGFHCLSWPYRFASTGEICVYGNETGGMAVATNIYGAHDGYDSFPLDDYSAPAEAAAGRQVDSDDGWVVLDSSF
jgi:hypothetical protein